MNSIEQFRRHVSAAAGVYSRLDGGKLTGRNSTSTDDTLDWHVKRAKEILAAAAESDTDTLPEYLDSARGARLAARWNRIERRHAGLR